MIRQKTATAKSQRGGHGKERKWSKIKLSNKDEKTQSDKGGEGIEGVKEIMVHRY